MNYVEIKSNENILRGFLELPQKDPKALVVFFHGFTGHKNENGFFFKTLAKSLTSNGFASLRVDFSGSGDSDGNFSEMTILTEMNDGYSILDFAKSLGISKIYLLGFSMGGAVAAQIAPKYLDTLSGLILMSPAGNMNQLAEGYNKNFKWYDEKNIDMGGYLLGIGFIDELRNIDLYDGVDKFIKPVLIIHGELDAAVPLEYGKKYESIYQNAILKPIIGAAHCYTTMEHRKIAEEEILAFIERTNGDEL